MKLEYFRDGSKQLQSEPSADTRFRTACDEELDMWDLLDVSGEHRKNNRCGFLIFAFVEGVDDDEGRDTGGFEWADDNLL